jgi:hypothetical protein
MASPIPGAGPLVPTFRAPVFDAPGPGSPVPGATSPQPASQQAALSEAVTGDAVPLVVVDGANVVGSVPDGWWRDRAGAAARLRDSLAPLPAAGLPDLPGPIEVVLVVEGKARDIPQTPGGVRIERAPGSGDDKIIDVVRAEHGRRTIVITADRGLRARAVALGAEIRGPSSVPR